MEGAVQEVKVSVKDGKPCEKILKIELGAEEVRKEYEAFYDAVAGEARIPGFRPGKAPRQVLAMHYRDEARQSVLKQLLSDSYRKAVGEQSLAPLGLPEIEEVKFEENSLSYQARVEIRPKIKLGRVAGLKASREKPELKPEEIEAALKRLQESFAQLKAVGERPAAMGDFLIADYVCRVEGKEIDKRSDDWLELREDEFLKGFSAQLVGARAGEEREIRVKLPENFARKDAAGKEALFQVKVKEIKEKKLPPLDDGLAKEAGECQTLEELKGKVAADLLAAKVREAEAAYEKALLEELMKHNRFDLPERVVARRVGKLVHDALDHYRAQDAPAAKRKELEEKLRGQLVPEARRQVHLAFLLDEIAVKENLAVAEEDLKARYVWVAARVREPLEKVEAYYREHEDEREVLREQIRNEKAIEFIKQRAKEA